MYDFDKAEDKAFRVIVNRSQVGGLKFFSVDSHSALLPFDRHNLEGGVGARRTFDTIGVSI